MWRRHPESNWGIKVLQTSALPLGYGAVPDRYGLSGRFWSGLRGSNPLPPPWQGGALPNELNPHGYAVYEHIALHRRKVAIRMGLEPTTSAVTGRQSNQLNYRTVWSASARLIIITHRKPFCNTFFEKNQKKFNFFYLFVFSVIILSKISAASPTKRQQGRVL